MIAPNSLLPSLESRHTTNASSTPPCVPVAEGKLRRGGKKVVAGAAEVLLASLCGYQNLNGEAVLRHRPPWANSDTTHLTEKGQIRPIFRGAGRDRGKDIHAVEDIENACPIAAVNKVIPLLDDGNRNWGNAAGGRITLGSGGSGGNDGGGASGRGGELHIRALYVPDRLADAPGVRSAIKVRVKSR